MASIQLDDVSLVFPFYDSSGRSLKKRVLSGSTGGRIGMTGRHASMVQALDNVTLDLRHGDRSGLIGHNGAGKTTLLRVLAGIYEPAIGEIKIEGRVAPLFDISLGMDPEASGYDNIFLRGLFLGMTRKQVQERIEEIATFTELGRFLDLPIYTYSAGMRHTITHNSPRCCAEPQVRGRNRGCVVGRSKGFSIRESRRPCD